MGLFDFLFGSRNPQVSDPEQLRGLLFEAAGTGDHRGLERLCRANQQMIVEHFATWQKAPAGLRDDPAAMQGYVQGLVAVAELFADRLGTPELLQRLTGTEQTNPLIRWQNALAQARQLTDELRYAEARDRLSPPPRPFSGGGPRALGDRAW